ncbi:monocarboxylate transporter 3-like [Mercenaria mercenaria]|uniref:monocarboxylate transporter 3-like n=1 Tax=Mercenaria mercenaria TaxID=6596 RepID=UPI00234F953F|nr:monocarboxylate transporter 3-like [Mercenaria mercenaria]
MSSVVEKSSDMEVSLTYASYERHTEASFLLSGNKSNNFLSNATLSKESTDSERVDRNGGKMLAPRSRAVIVMAACLYINLSCFGMVPALGVVYVELISALQCLRSEAALVQGLCMGLSLGGGILFTTIVTKYDTGACVMAASVVAGVAMACGSLARDIGTVIALVGVVMGTFTSVNVLSTSIVINWTFTDNRKFALGILTIGATIGQTAMPYIADALIEAYSWNGCLFILSAITYLNCIPCGLIIHYSKRYFQKGSETGGAKGDTTSVVSFLTDSAFMVYIVASFIFITFGPVEQWFVVDVAVLKGFGVQSGATLLSLNGIFGFAGRIISTVILKFYPKTRPELHICYGFLLWAVAHFGVIASPVYWGMFLAMILRGLTTSIVIVFLPSLQLELRGPESFPRTVAISYMIMGVGDVIGGYLGGYSVDVTGSYNLIFYIATVGSVYCGISMLIIFVIFKRRNRRSNQYQQLPS